MVTIHTTDQLGITLDGENTWIAIPENDDDVDWIMDNIDLLKKIYAMLDRNNPIDIN